MYPILAFLFSLTAEPIQAAAPPVQVDVELLLAVDVSGSMDIEEAQIQRLGYVEALKHPDFINAVKGGRLGRIAIGYFEWAGAVNVQSVVDWRVIDDSDDAQEFAEQVDKPVRGSRRGTSLSNAILFGTRSLESNAFSGIRRVLDVSGDGPNNTGPPVLPALPFFYDLKKILIHKVKPVQPLLFTKIILYFNRYLLVVPFFQNRI